MFFKVYVPERHWLMGTVPTHNEAHASHFPTPLDVISAVEVCLRRQNETVARWIVHVFDDNGKKANTVGIEEFVKAELAKRKIKSTRWGVA